MERAHRLLEAYNKKKEEQWAEVLRPMTYEQAVEFLINHCKVMKFLYPHYKTNPFEELPQIEKKKEPVYRLRKSKMVQSHQMKIRSDYFHPPETWNGPTRRSRDTEPTTPKFVSPPREDCQQDHCRCNDQLDVEEDEESLIQEQDSHSISYGPMYLPKSK